MTAAEILVKGRWPMNILNRCGSPKRESCCVFVDARPYPCRPCADRAIAQARVEALTLAEQRIADIIAANRDMPDAAHIRAVGERCISAIRALMPKREEGK